MLAIVFITGFKENDFCVFQDVCALGMARSLAVSGLMSAVFHHLTVRPVNLMILFLGKFVRFCWGMRDNSVYVFDMHEAALKAVLKQTARSRSADLYIWLAC